MEESRTAALAGMHTHDEIEHDVLSATLTVEYTYSRITGHAGASA